MSKVTIEQVRRALIAASFVNPMDTWKAGNYECQLRIKYKSNETAQTIDCTVRQNIVDLLSRAFLSDTSRNTYNSLAS